MRPWMLVAAAPLLFAAVPGACLAQNLSIELSLERESYRQADTVQIRYTVTNHESRPVAILKWNTPLEGLIGDPFIVLLDGQERKFRGAMASRTDPVASNWALLPPNGSLSASIDLAGAYDLTAAGAYEIRARHGFHHVAFDKIPNLRVKALQGREVRSNTVRLRMLDRRVAPEAALTGPSGQGAISSFVGCTAPQQTSLNTAFGAMSTKAVTVTSTVGGWTCSDWDQSAAAKTMFGAPCTAAGLTKVQGVTSTVSTRAAGTVILDCSGTNTCSGPTSFCQTAGVVAFTCLGGANSTVYACPLVFFNYPPVNQLDSQETILYHELSHWAMTADTVYGCKGCASLAAGDSTAAQNNASNYMYFAAFLTNGGAVSCGVEHLAGAAALLGLLVLVTGRRIARRMHAS